jgi:hypothetical protein
MDHLPWGTRVRHINNEGDTGTVVGWDAEGDPIVRWDLDDDLGYVAVYRCEVFVIGGEG